MVWVPMPGVPAAKWVQERIHHAMTIGAHGAALAVAVLEVGHRRGHHAVGPGDAAIGRGGDVGEQREAQSLAPAVEVGVADVRVAEERAGGGVVGPDLLLVQAGGGARYDGATKKGLGPVGLLIADAGGGDVVDVRDGDATARC